MAPAGVHASTLNGLRPLSVHARDLVITLELPSPLPPGLNDTLQASDLVKRSKNSRGRIPDHAPLSVAFDATGQLNLPERLRDGDSLGWKRHLQRILLRSCG